MIDSVNVHLKMMLDGVEVEAAVPVPASPAPRRVLLPLLQNLTDTVVEVARRNVTGWISCKKGCDACCRQMVPISPAETYALAALIDAMPSARAADILSRFDQARDELDGKGLLERLHHRHELTSEQQCQLDRDYFAAQVACPFLHEKACSIHPLRPLACREFLVTSPARNCRNPTADKVVQLPLGAKVSVALASQDDAPWLPLVLARDFVASVPEKTPEDTPAKILQSILRAL